jgi:hypothetical protein
MRRAPYRERLRHVLPQPDRNPVGIGGATLKHRAKPAATSVESRVAVPR